VCKNLETRTLVYETIRDVVIPGLEAAGLGAATAWERRR